MKIVVTVEFDGRDPVAQMVKMFGEPLARSMADAAVPKINATSADAPPRPRGRPFGTTKPKPQMTRAEGLLPGEDPGIQSERQPVGVVASVAVEPAAPVEIIAAVEEVAKEPVTKALTVADTQAAIEKLYNAKGVQVALGTLASFAVARAQDIPAGQRAAFLERVDMLMKS